MLGECKHLVPPQYGQKHVSCCCTKCCSRSRHRCIRSLLLSPPPPPLHPQASVRSTLTLQNEQENCRFTWDWWPRLPPVLPPTTGESFPAPPSPRTSPHERSHPHDGVVFGARVLPAPWLSSVGAVAMSSDLLSAPPLGPHAGGAVASPSAFMFAPPLGSYAGGLAASQTSASALYPPIGSHAVAMYSELVPAPPLGSHGSFFRPAPRLSRRHVHTPPIHHHHHLRDCDAASKTTMYTTTTICVIAMLQAPPLGPHAGGAVALSLELDICLLLRLPVTPSAPLTPLALSCAPRAPHHLTSKTFILSDIAHMHQSTVVFQFLFAAFEQQNV